MRTCPSDAERRRAWAADRLGLPADATGPAARAAFLRRLPGVEFVPPPAWRAALDVLEDRPPRGIDAEWARADEDAGRAEVEAFARSCWSLAPDERRRQWDELHKRWSGDPLAAVRLRHLEAGLGVRADAKAGDERIDELADWARALYLLRPAERQVQRVVIQRGFARGFDAMTRAYEEAARRLRELRPEVADLAPELIDPLATARGRRWQLHEARAALARHVTPVNDGAAVTSGSRPTRAWGTLGFLLVYVIIKALTAATSTTTHPPPDGTTYRPTVEPMRRFDNPAADEAGDAEALQRILDDIARKHKARQNGDVPANRERPPADSPPTGKAP
jgi:hypothetical protein